MNEIIKRVHDVGFIGIFPKEVLEITTVSCLSKVRANKLSQG